MSDRKPFVLRLNPEKLKALEKWAADEFRSTNGQIEYILDQALRKSGRWKTVSSTKNTNIEEK
ncbi:MAG: Arc family DNA-binding protein [Bacteroidales bacterium]|nr:Arc family DNA-binding protein [Bacteroidales bacterium]